MWRILTAGESHGHSLVAIIEGLPSGLKIDLDFINQELSRRQEGFGRGKRMSLERDRVEIISGLRHGLTLGSPLTLVIQNRDFSLEKRASLPLLSPRPGHADLAGVLKYDFNDCRDVWERASARCTAIMVAGGAVAKIFLYQFGQIILSHVLSIGKVSVQPPRGLSYEEIFLRVEKSPLRVYQKKAEEAMIREIERAEREGDTLGGIFEVVCMGVPVGLGSYSQLDQRLDGRLAQAVMSIPSVKGVEIGLGFAASPLPGSRVHDEIFYSDGKFFRRTNRAGGLEGGLTNGEPIVIRGAMKPIPTLRNPLSSVDIKTKKKRRAEYTRADICAVPAGGVIAEAMVALELGRAMREKFGGDSLREIKRNFKGYIDQLKAK